MARYSVSVYFKTGFNSINIPFNQAVVETATKKEYNDTYFLREDLDNPQIKINDSYDNLCDVDYVKLVNQNTSRVSFYFAVPRAAAKNTTIMNLDLDALTTLGGAGVVEYEDGWQTDGHISKEEDTLFGNITKEPIEPVDEIVIAGTQEIKPTTGSNADLDIVVSNCNLPDLGSEAVNGNISSLTGIVEDETGVKESTFYMPMIKGASYEDDDGTVSYSSPFIWKDPKTNEAHFYSIPNTVAYSLNNPVVFAGINALHSAGQQGLNNSYRIPKEWTITSDTGSSTGVFKSVSGIGEKQEVNMPFDFGAFKNKKVCTMYRTFMITNLASGDQVVKEAQEIYKTGMTKPVIDLWSDPSPTGKPFARFDYQNSSDYLYDCACQGSQWTTNQIALQGAAGSLWNSLDYAFANKSITRDVYKNQSDAFSGTIKDAIGLGGSGLEANTKSGMSAVGLITNAASALVDNALYAGHALNNTGDPYYSGTLGEAEYEKDKLNQKRNEAAVEYMKNTGFTTPTVSFTPQPSLALYGMNKFIVQELRPSEKSLKMFDNYFQRFGYSKINVPLTTACFNKRQYYCFVRAFNVAIKSNFGMRIRNAAAAQLNNGVRVWKVLPDAKYYELN